MGWVLSFIIAFLAAAALAPLIIPSLKRLGLGQSIKELGPKWHSGKAGTPTMGGIIIIGAFFAALFIRGVSREGAIIGLCALLFGIVGFADDYIKVALKRNLGLTTLQKLAAQTAIAVAFVVYLTYFEKSPGWVYIPFTTIKMMPGVWLMPLQVIWVLYIVNCVNLTDGLDGLAAWSFAVLSFLLIAVSLRLGNGAAAAVSGAAGGAALGFLLYNSYPARVFMGDTGSLFLGGYIAAASLVLKQELVVMIASAVFIFEGLSVILQVISFKLTGKRIFKMAPVHHHFEMCGFRETTIVALFTAATALFCAAAWLGLVFGKIN